MTWEPELGCPGLESGEISRVVRPEAASFIDSYLIFMLVLVLVELVCRHQPPRAHLSPLSHIYPLRRLIPETSLVVIYIRQEEEKKKTCLCSCGSGTSNTHVLVCIVFVAEVHYQLQNEIIWTLYPDYS